MSRTLLKIPADFSVTGLDFSSYLQVPHLFLKPLVIDITICIILFTDPPLGQDMTQGQFLSGV